MENAKTKKESLVQLDNPLLKEGETLDLSNLRDQMNFTFDYEINNIKLDDPNNESSLNSKMYYFDKDYNQNRIINYNNFKDSLKKSPYRANSSQLFKACFIKHLVSKKKIRFQNDEFDLDMAYITDRVIAMGFPSIGCEKLYRNSIQDVIAFFERYHKGNVKIYNLCLEKNRIYDKSLFGKSKVGLFPSLDHNPCPVKLILEFCVDICLFLIQNLESVAAIHCKAGKGRTGVMICSYLIFSGLCKNMTEAIEYYGKMRTTNGRGVTIASQIRYIKYFETFLISNFYAPYIYLIPKIIKEHLFIKNQSNFHVKNLLINLQKDPRYFTSPNYFRVNSIKVGPLEKDDPIIIQISNLSKKLFTFPKAVSTFIQEVKLPSKDTGLYFYYETNDTTYPIHSDIKIDFSKGISFYICLNLWYSSLETIEEFLKNNQGRSTTSLLIENNEPLMIDTGKGFTEIEMTDIILDDKLDKENNPNNINDGTFQNGFIIFNEDQMEITGNTKKNLTQIIDESDEANQRGTISSSIKHNAELNEIIRDLNVIRGRKGKTLFDKNNMIIKLTAQQLDKFSNHKKMPNLTVEINYSLQ